MPLFDGTSLKGWKVISLATNTQPVGSWYVRDGMLSNDKDREDPQPDHGKGPPDGKGQPEDHGRPVPRHGSAATTFGRRMKLR